MKTPAATHTHHAFLPFKRMLLNITDQCFAVRRVGYYYCKHGARWSSLWGIHGGNVLNKNLMKMLKKTEMCTYRGSMSHHAAYTMTAFTDFKLTSAFGSHGIGVVNT